MSNMLPGDPWGFGLAQRLGIFQGQLANKKLGLGMAMDIGGEAQREIRQNREDFMHQGQQQVTAQNQMLEKQDQDQEREDALKEREREFQQRQESLDAYREANLGQRTQANQTNNQTRQNIAGVNQGLRTRGQDIRSAQTGTREKGIQGRFDVREKRIENAPPKSDPEQKAEIAAAKSAERSLPPGQGDQTLADPAGQNAYNKLLPIWRKTYKVPEVQSKKPVESPDDISNAIQESEDPTDVAPNGEGGSGTNDPRKTFPSPDVPRKAKPELRGFAHLDNQDKPIDDTYYAQDVKHWSIDPGTGKPVEVENGLESDFSIPQAAASVMTGGAANGAMGIFKALVSNAVAIPASELSSNLAQRAGFGEVGQTIAGFVGGMAGGEGVNKGLTKVEPHINQFIDNLKPTFKPFSEQTPLERWRQRGSSLPGEKPPEELPQENAPDLSEDAQKSRRAALAGNLRNQPGAPGLNDLHPEDPLVAQIKKDTPNIDTSMGLAPLEPIESINTKIAAENPKDYQAFLAKNIPEADPKIGKQAAQGVNLNDITNVPAIAIEKIKELLPKIKAFAQDTPIEEKAARAQVLAQQRAIDPNFHWQTAMRPEEHLPILGKYSADQAEVVIPEIAQEARGPLSQANKSFFSDLNSVKDASTQIDPGSPEDLALYQYMKTGNPKGLTKPQVKVGDVLIAKLNEISDRIFKAKGINRATKWQAEIMQPDESSGLGAFENAARAAARHEYTYEAVQDMYKIANQYPHTTNDLKQMIDDGIPKDIAEARLAMGKSQYDYAQEYIKTKFKGKPSDAKLLLDRAKKYPYGVGKVISGLDWASKGLVKATSLAEIGGNTSVIDTHIIGSMMQLSTHADANLVRAFKQLITERIPQVFNDLNISGAESKPILGKRNIIAKGVDAVGNQVFKPINAVVNNAMALRYYQAKLEFGHLIKQWDATEFPPQYRAEAIENYALNEALKIQACRAPFSTAPIWDNPLVRVVGQFQRPGYQISTAMLRRVIGTLSDSEMGAWDRVAPSLKLASATAAILLGGKALGFDFTKKVMHVLSGPFMPSGSGTDSATPIGGAIGGAVNLEEYGRHKIFGGMVNKDEKRAEEYSPHQAVGSLFPVGSELDRIYRANRDYHSGKISGWEFMIRSWDPNTSKRKQMSDSYNKYQVQ